MKSLAFIIPTTTNMIKKSSHSLIKTNASLHPIYDVAAVSTYVAYFLNRYWDGQERKDVEFFGFVMALVWNVTRDHDATIFLMLWLMGGVSEFVSKSFLAGGNGMEAENFRVGVKLGGYMSFLLLVFDLLDVVLGY